MISGLYTAATAMDAAAMQHHASAENMAHVQMPGFRRRIVHQATFATRLEAQQRPQRFSEHLGTTARHADTNMKMDFSHGTIEQSGRPLDVALDGPGFFEVEGPDGPLYTRNGAFHTTADGRLVTIDGLEVQGARGPIRIPPNTSGEGIEVSADGRLSANGVQFDQLRRVQFEDRQQLRAAGASLFRARDGVEPTESTDAVLQGHLERSNVAVMNELVGLMLASRQYEAAQRVMRTIDESLEQLLQGGR